MLWYCDAQILLFPSHIAAFTINSSPEQVYVAVYGIIVILEHTPMFKDYNDTIYTITFSVLSCLVQEIWHKIHNLVMA